jgi:branched-chain amino acid transport system ATP-binding protein
MAEPLLEVAGLVKRFGGLIATDNLHLTVAPGAVHAVIGPNGAGKTTLVAQLQGELTPDAGAIRFAGRDVTRLKPHQRAACGIARSFQITSIFPDASSSSRWRWRPDRACCCSTSRWPAWARRRAPAWCA